MQLFNLHQMQPYSGAPGSIGSPYMYGQPQQYSNPWTPQGGGFQDFGQWASQQPFPSGKLTPYGPFTDPNSPASMHRNQQLMQQYMQQMGSQAFSGGNPSLSENPPLTNMGPGVGGPQSGSVVDRIGGPQRPAVPIPNNITWNGQNAAAAYNAYQNTNDQALKDAMVRDMQGQDNGAGFNAAMRGAGYMLNGGPGGQYSYTGGHQGAPPPQANTPFGGGFADAVHQAQAAVQKPQVSTYSSQGQHPFSPLANEGYGSAPVNQFSAQNRTRGMGGGMNSGRPTMPFGTAGSSHYR